MDPRDEDVGTAIPRSAPFQSLADRIECAIGNRLRDTERGALAALDDRQVLPQIARSPFEGEFAGPVAFAVPVSGFLDDPLGSASLVIERRKTADSAIRRRGRRRG